MGKRTRLAEFITHLATDFDAYQAYEEDPETAMNEAGLEEKEKELLRTGSFEEISEAFYRDGRGPHVPVIQGP